MTLDILNTIFLGIIACSFIVMGIAWVPLLFKLRSGVKEATALTGEVRRQIAPVMIHVNRVASDVEGMTATVRREVDRIGESTEKMAKRVSEMADLVEVVQAEIREPLLKSVATITGLRRVIGRFF